MTTPSSGRLPVPPTLLLPPIRGFPASATDAAPDALGAYVATTRSWGRQPVVLTTPVRCALWLDVGGAAALGGWLVAVHVGAAGRGPVYELMTLWHPGLLLVLAGICVTTLLVTAPFTRGLTQVGGSQLGLVVAAAGAGFVALLGVLLVAVLAVALTFLAVVAFLAAVERG